MRIYKISYNMYGIVFILAHSVADAIKKFDLYYDKKDSMGKPNNLKIEQLEVDLVT